VKKYYTRIYGWEVRINENLGLRILENGFSASLDHQLQDVISRAIAQIIILHESKTVPIKDR
jgi:hypothetical protein